MIGLADCNNFFVSCERTINKDLEGKAVVVMSNNDGCAIARSNEAKALGIKMGQPMFELKNLINSGQLVAISSNYALYHEISNTIHSIFHKYAPIVIDYSVDEAFFDLDGVPIEAIEEIGKNICNECWQKVGIPVTVGFSFTKTLAKIASEIGKKSKQNVVLLTDLEDINHVLDQTPIGDIWGIGRRTARKLYFEGIHTAKDYIDCDIHHIKHLTGINGVKTHNELRMIPCITLDNCNRPIQDSISESRTFSRDISDYEVIKTRLTTYTTHCATRLRDMKSECSSVIVYLATNRFHNDQPQQFPSIEIKLNNPTASTSILVEAMIEGLNHIYDSTITYKKAGIVLANISHIKIATPSLFDPIDNHSSDSSQLLMKTIDNINHTSSNVLQLASQIGFGKISQSSVLSSTFQFRKKK